jgi:D-alanyl-D-alanine carboxypeptidase/D-alanyl-D-alanine-endopeptidase (penicillin-binding protein 4)
MRAFITLFFLLGVAKTVPAQAKGAFFEDFMGQESLKHATVGFALMDADGNLLHGHNEETSLAPASTQKLLTSITALEILGADHRFTTTLSIQGSVSDSVLIGNVVITSGGDPTFASENFSKHYMGYFESWVEALKSEGINAIDGQVKVDDKIFKGDRHAGSSALDDVGNYYGAGAPGFSFMDNEFTVFFNTNGLGELSEVAKIEPAAPKSIDVINRVRSGSVSGDNVIIYSLDQASEVFLTGELPKHKKGFTVRGAMPDVTEWAEFYFTHQFEKAGFLITREERSGPLFTNSKEIHRTKSPELIDILKVLNRKSVNTYADVMLKHIGAEYSKDPTLKGGAQAVARYWADGGLNVSGIYMEDGSGLSRKNNVTAKLMTEVLAHVSGSDQVNEMMNEASKSGSVKAMWGSSPSGDIQAKSGYIGRVRAYSGYLIKSGKKYPFFFTINNYHGSSRAIRTEMGAILKAVRSEL